jgi:chromosomal replication initiation ATPase DnaA
MKKQIFNQYLEAICELFSVTKEDIMSKTKRADVSEARQLLYYLCYIRPMKFSEIQKYMIEEGYDPRHTPIIRGVKSVEAKVESDRDYKSIVERIHNSVFI